MEKDNLRSFRVFKRHRKPLFRPAFTIVELLVVIVVIGILATITIVSYTGISQRATTASLQSDLDNASKQLKLFQVDNGNYPATIDCTIPDSSTNKCIKVSNGATYEYYVDNTNNKQIYCVTITKNNSYYSINNSGTSVPAAYCPVLYLDAGNKDSYSGTGTAWKDLSGWGNDGTLLNGVGYDSTNGGAMSFDGVNDYVGVPYTSLLSPASQITFEAVAYLNNWDITDYVRILSKTEGGGYQIGLNGSVGTGYAGGLVYLNGSYRIVHFALTSLSPGWHYFSFTFDGRYFKMYSDGSNVGTYDLGSVSTISYSCNNYLMVGVEASCGSTPVDGHFSGIISVTSIYNRALSAPEILQNFNTLKDRYGL